MRDELRDDRGIVFEQRRRTASAASARIGVRLQRNEIATIENRLQCIADQRIRFR